MNENNTGLQLNSERVAERFGSYGIDILYADETKRLSSLFSEDASGKTMRTFALVEYTAADEPRIAREHERICAGESLGAVFKDQGWTIDKTASKLAEGRFDIDTLTYLSEMKIDMPATLTMHAYVFRVRKDADSIDYAIVTEIHHPNYLRMAELATILSDTISAS